MKTLKMIAAVVAIVSTTTLFAQEMKVNLEKSSLQWTGKKVTGEHTGYINLKEAKLNMKDNKIVDGKFVIDMSSITNTDLTDVEYNQKLVNHLKSDDFFGVATFPSAELLITESTSIVNNQMTVKGNLTIKGITNPIEFIATKKDNSLTAKIVIDRSKYDVRYGSGSFFDGLGDKMIYDDFEINAILVVADQAI